jgi:hypothetical protein
MSRLMWPHTRRKPVAIIEAMRPSPRTYLVFLAADAVLTLATTIAALIQSRQLVGPR